MFAFKEEQHDDRKHNAGGDFNVLGSLGEVSYTQLKSGSIKVKDQEIPTASLSSYAKAREIAGILKDWIEKGKFLLSEPVASIPGPDSGCAFRSLPERPIGQLLK